MRPALFTDEPEPEAVPDRPEGAWVIAYNRAQGSRSLWCGRNYGSQGPGAWDREVRPVLWRTEHEAQDYLASRTVLLAAPRDRYEVVEVGSLNLGEQLLLANVYPGGWEYCE